MLLSKNGDIVTDEECDSIEKMPPLEEVPFDEERLCEERGINLVVMRALSTQVKEKIDEAQRENIFHARCLINSKTCSLIVDGGSCTNVASTTLVERLALPMKDHPRPYKLQWLNNSGEVKVTKQVMVSFKIGSYEDQVTCDVVPMQACHVLLGRPWQFDRQVIYNGLTNRYSFLFHGKKVTLVPLTPKQVYEDQSYMQRQFEMEVERRKKRKEGLREKEQRKDERGKEKKECMMASMRDVRLALSAEKALVMLMYKEACYISDDVTSSLPSVVVSVLQEYTDLFPEEVPKGLPPVRGIEHHIDFIPGASIPNKPAY